MERFNDYNMSTLWVMVQSELYGDIESYIDICRVTQCKEFEDDSEYYWDVIGSTRRNIPLLEARDENGNVVTASTTTNVGVGTAVFELVFPEDWFADGEVIVGNLNEVYPMRILGNPRMEGTNAVYRCELMGGITQGIPAERLLPGERFSYEYAPVERALSRKVGDRLILCHLAA